MPAVVALLDSRPALTALRRGLAGSRWTVVACRTPGSLLAALADRLVDAVVLGVQQARRAGLAELRARYPAIPTVAYGVVRADDGDLLLSWHRLGLRAIVVAGVDDPVLGDLVARHTASALRRRALESAPRLLRLTEPIQLAAWRVLQEEGGGPIETAEIARRLGMSREHLSRQFGAGGAPNLKRVIDFLRVAAAAELAANPGYDPPAIAARTGFSSPGHLRATVRRLTGSDLGALAAGGPAAVLGGFVQVGLRSRSE